MPKSQTAKSVRRATELERRERAAELRRLAARKDRNHRLLVIGSAVLVSVALVAVAALSIVLKQHAARISGLRHFTKLSQQHTQKPVSYPQTPPVGGAHDPVWLNCGIYNTPVRNESAVHDLEHGAVWITYLPSLASSDVAKLSLFVRDHTIGKLDLSPYPGLPAPVVASAWGYQVRLTGPDDPRLLKFVTRFQGSPKAPEATATCATGGTGKPLG